jgi:hypothetical protein
MMHFLVRPSQAIVGMKPKYQQQLRDCRGIAKLGDLLRAGDGNGSCGDEARAAARGNAARQLHCLACYRATDTGMIAAGCVGALVGLLREEQSAKELKRSAAWTLQALSGESLRGSAGFFSALGFSSLSCTPQIAATPMD